MLRRERRTKLEIFNDILIAIQKESFYGNVKPTRVQQKCNISYDKFSKYVDELTKRKLITHDSTLCITDKGKQLLIDYVKIKSFLTEMKLEYMSGEDPHEI